MPFEIPQLEIDGAILPGDFRIDGADSTDQRNTF